MQTEIDPRDLIGHKAVDKNGDKIGTVDEVYLDDATGQPEWAAVRTGLFGRDAFVPLTTSEFVSDELRVPYEKSLVKDSPDFGVGQHLSPAQELQLYRYYGLEVPTGTGQHAAEPGVKANGGQPSAPTAPSNGAPTVASTGPQSGSTTIAEAGTVGAADGAAGGGAAGGGAAAGMVAGSAMAKHREKAEHEKPVEQTLTTPTVQPLANAGRTSSFLTGGAPTAAGSRQQPGTAGRAAAAAPAAAAMSAPSAPSVQTPPAAPFPGSGAGMGAGTGAGVGAAAGTAAASAPQVQHRPDPLTDPLPGPGAAATSTSSKDPVPAPLEIVCREERLDISTEWHVLGRARLRKYVTSEQVERRVPVVRERIRVERVPVSAEERANLTEAEIAESVEEVTLHEERLVVKKTVVPVERIRLVTERVTEEEVVREQLHREHVQVHDGSKPAATPVAPAGAAGTALGDGGYASGSPASAAPAASSSQPSTGQSPATPLRPANPMAPSRNPDLPGHAMGA